MAGLSSLSYIATPDLFDKAIAVVGDSRDGNTAHVSLPLGDDEFGPELQLIASGDGANALAGGLELLAAKVRAAHTEWLRTKAAEQ